MPINYSSYSATPYFDDFDEDKKFAKILFRPGFAVQTRELNQLQTILQNQIERVGNHLFQEGAMIVPGYAKYDNRVSYVKIELDAGRHTEEYVEANLIGKIITNIDPRTVAADDPRVRAQVVSALFPSSPIYDVYSSIYSTSYYDNKILLYVRYVSSNEAQTTFDPNDTLWIESETDPLDIHTGITETIPDDPNGGSSDDTLITGSACIATVDRGIYYTKGYFVIVDSHTAVVDPFSSNVNARVGLKVTETIITPDENTSINDNAIGSPNFFAPGAHRLRIDLDLTPLLLDSIGTDDEDSFIELMRIENGLLVSQISRTLYNELAKEFAHRTFDESGDYTVDPFVADVIEREVDDGGGGTEEKLFVELDPGRAYVKGFEIETIGKTSIELDRARDTGFENNRIVSTPIGNFVRITNLYGLPSFATEVAVDPSVYMEVELYNTPIVDATDTSNAPIPKNPDGSNASPIGTARVRDLRFLNEDINNDINDAIYQLFLFDIDLAGKSFSQVCYVRDVNNSFGARVHFVSRYLSGTATYSASGTQIDGSSLADWDSPADRVGDNDWLRVRGYNSGTGEREPENDFFLRAADRPASNGQILQVDPDSGAQNVTAFTDKRIEYIYAGLEESGKNVAIFPLPHEYIADTKTDDGINHEITYGSYRTFVENIIDPANVKISLSGSTIFSAYSQQTYFLSASDATYRNGELLEVPSSLVTYTSQEVTFDLTGLVTAGGDIRIIAPIIINGGTLGTPISKNLIDVQADYGTVGDPLDMSERVLPYADVYKIKAVVMSEDVFTTVTTVDPDNLLGNDEDITDRFQLDTGQRDNWYENGRILLRPGQSQPTGLVRVFYQYFDHSSNRGFFATESYSGLDPEDIPSYRSTTNGSTYELRDCLDFRPLKLAGTYQYTSDLPVQTVTMDYHYYLNRIDKLYLDPIGKFRIAKGVPGVTPKEPADPDNGMVLYKLYVRAFTKDASDVTTEYVENKRYTMRDIGRLEKRIQNLEYYTSLTLLEKETEDLEILDADGLDRFKNGFIVDPFYGHGIGDTQNIDYRCAVDMLNGELRPMSKQEMIKLQLYETINPDGSRAANGIFDTVGGTTGSKDTEWQNGTTIVNTIFGGNLSYQKTGDLVTLPYTEETLVTQPVCSNTININPFAVFTFLGQIGLDPAVDEWKDTKNLPAKVIEEEGNFSSLKAKVESDQKAFGDEFGTIWRDWENDRAKKPTVETLDELIGIRMERATTPMFHVSLTGDVVDTEWTNIDPATGQPNGQWPVRWHRDYRSTTTTSTFEVRQGIRQKVIPKIVTKNLGEKVIDVSYIPFMRSRDIIFRAKGLKPSTKVHPFFDNVDVSAYVKAVANPYETDVTQFEFDNMTITDLITDKSGSLSGTFRLPNSEAIRFKTGHKYFTLTDDSENGKSWTTNATAVYRAQGIQETKQETIISTRNAEIVEETFTQHQELVDVDVNFRTETGPWVDPIAQSFLVDTDGGAFITKIHAYIETKDPNIPLTLQVREVVNGIPGKKRLPFGNVTLLPSEVVTNEVTASGQLLVTHGDGSTETRTLKYDQLEPTPFVFESPIYLKEDVEYCFVLMANSTKYNAWIATIGQDPQTAVADQPAVLYKKLGTNEPITEQPYAGSFFKSQNNSTWTPDQFIDIKFDIFKAKFDIDSSASRKLHFHNDTLAPEPILAGNPIETKAGSNKIRIHHRNHGYTLSGSAKQFNIQLYNVLLDANDELNGLPFDGTSPSLQIDANGYGVVAARIVHADLDTYTVAVFEADGITPVNATITGRRGGSDVSAEYNLKMDAMELSMGEIILPRTAVRYSVRSTSANMVHGASFDKYFLGDGNAYVPVINNETFLFNDPRAVLGGLNEFDIEADIPYDPEEDDRVGGRPSFWVEAELVSENPNISPVIDLQRTNVVVISNVLDEPSETRVNITNNDVNNLDFDDDVIATSASITLDSLEDDIATVSFAGTPVQASPFERMNQGEYVNVYNASDVLVGKFEVVSSTVDGLGGATLKVIDVGGVFVTGTYTIVRLKGFKAQTAGTAATGGTKYITRRLTLSTPSTAARFSFAGHRPPSANIELYYKIAKVDDNTPFDEIPYVKATIDKDVPASTSDNNFREYAYTIENLELFLAVAAKVVMTSSNSARPPKIREFRLIALDA